MLSKTIAMKISARTGVDLLTVGTVLEAAAIEAADSLAAKKILRLYGLGKLRIYTGRPSVRTNTATGIVIQKEGRAKIRFSPRRGLVQVLNTAWRNVYRPDYYRSANEF